MHFFSYSFHFVPFGARACTTHIWLQLLMFHSMEALAGATTSNKNNQSKVANKRANIAIFILFYFYANEVRMDFVRCQPGQ